MKMRTIDPNALSQRIMKSKEQTADRMIPVGAVLEMIRTAKDVTKRGHWDEGYDTNKYGFRWPFTRCSECKSQPPTTGDFDEYILSNFCPNCGAVMDLEGEYSETD